MVFMTSQNRVSCSLCLLLVMAAFQAFSGPGVKDTLVERLFGEGQYRMVSVRIAGELKKQNSSSGNDLRLYYYNKLSMTHFRLNNFDSAMICARQALKLSSASKDSTLISDTWKMMSYSFNRLGQLDSAIYFTNKLMNYSKRAGNDHQYRNALVSLGTILMQNQRPAEALKNFREANRINKKMSDTASFVYDYFNIGLVHLKLKQYDSCLYYMKEALGILRNRTVPQMLLMTYGTMADCYLATGKKAERMKYLLLAMDVAKQTGSSQFLAMGYCNLIEGCLNERDFSGAVKYGFAADSLLKREPFPVQQMKLDSMMYVAFSRLSKPAEALARYMSFMKMKNQVISENQSARLNRLMVEYNVKEKNLRIENQESDIRSKKKQLQLLGLLLVITVFFIVRLTSQNIKLRKFRESLYRKEKYLDKQIAEMMMYKFPSLTVNTTPPGNATVQPDPGKTDESMPQDPLQQEDLYVRLLEVIENQKLYLDTEMNLKTLINLLGTNKTYLYQAISQNSSENFRGLINRCRINEAKRIIEESVARSSVFDGASLYSATGFSSSVSFFRAFKQFTGLTPREYATQTRKELRKPNLKMVELDEFDDDDG